MDREAGWWTTRGNKRTPPTSKGAQLVFPVVERTTKQKWMTAPILQKMDQRRLAKGNEALYNLLDREIRQECKAAKDNMLAAQCDVIEQLNAAHKSNLMHSEIRSVTGRKSGSNPTTCIEDKEGNIIMEKEKIISRWYEYIGELYNDDRGDIPEIVAEVESSITQRDVEHALRGMPMKKPPGPDDITTEMLVAAGNIGITELTKLVNMMYVQGSFPGELNKFIFITLPKVNGTINCEKHRTIMLAMLSDTKMRPGLYPLFHLALVLNDFDRFVLWINVRLHEPSHGSPDSPLSFVVVYPYVVIYLLNPKFHILVVLVQTSRLVVCTRNIQGHFLTVNAVTGQII